MLPKFRPATLSGGVRPSLRPLRAATLPPPTTLPVGHRPRLVDPADDGPLTERRDDILTASFGDPVTMAAARQRICELARQLPSDYDRDVETPKRSHYDDETAARPEDPYPPPYQDRFEDDERETNEDSGERRRFSDSELPSTAAREDLVPDLPSQSRRGRESSQRILDKHLPPMRDLGALPFAKTMLPHQQAPAMARTPMLGVGYNHPMHPAMPPPMPAGAMGASAQAMHGSGPQYLPPGYGMPMPAYAQPVGHQLQPAEDGEPGPGVGRFTWFVFGAAFGIFFAFCAMGFLPRLAQKDEPFPAPAPLPAAAAPKTTPAATGGMAQGARPGMTAPAAPPSAASAAPTNAPAAPAATNPPAAAVATNAPAPPAASATATTVRAAPPPRVVQRPPPRRAAPRAAPADDDEPAPPPAAGDLLNAGL